MTESSAVSCPLSATLRATPARHGGWCVVRVRIHRRPDSFERCRVQLGDTAERNSALRDSPGASGRFKPRSGESPAGSKLVKVPRGRSRGLARLRVFMVSGGFELADCQLATQQSATLRYEAVRPRPTRSNRVRAKIRPGPSKSHLVALGRMVEGCTGVPPAGTRAGTSQRDVPTWCALRGSIFVRIPSNEV